MNNNNLVVDVHQFDANQHIYVYVNGACVKQATVPNDKMVSTIKNFCETYDIPRVNFFGNEAYVSRYAAELGTQFHNNDIIINIQNH